MVSHIDEVLLMLSLASMTKSRLTGFISVTTANDMHLASIGTLKESREKTHVEHSALIHLLLVKLNVWMLWIHLRLLCVVNSTQLNSPAITQPIPAKMNTSDVRALVEELQSVSLDMEADVLEKVNRCAQIIEDMSAQQCRNVIDMAGSRPLLLIFMSDGWGTDIRSRVLKEHEGVKVHGRTRLREEFVMQRTLLKTAVGGDPHMSIKFERPRKLESQKCLDMYVAACDRFPLLKISGHKSISLSMYMQDGLFAKPFGKLMRARHSLFFKKQCCPLKCTDSERELLEFKDWVFVWTCCTHACSKALKWGMKKLVSSTDLADDVHISISALLRGSTGIYMSVPQLIASYVSFDRPDPDSCTSGNTALFWTLLDVAPTDLDVFLKVNPMFDGQRLHVSGSLIGDPECVHIVTAIIHYCLKWCDFSDTRWTKCGLCARLWLRSLMVGTDALVDLTMKNDAVSKWHLNGYMKKCSAPVRKYLAVCAAAGRPSKNMLLELLEDDRFLLHAGKLWDVLMAEHNYLMSAPQVLYDSVGAFLHIDAEEIKSDVIQASLTSISYLYKECWVPLSQPPLKYTQGDVRANIEDLKMDMSVVDGVSLKMQALALMGYEDDVIAACHQLKKNCIVCDISRAGTCLGSPTHEETPNLRVCKLACRDAHSQCPGFILPRCI